MTLPVLFDTSDRMTDSIVFGDRCATPPSPSLMDSRDRFSDAIYFGDRWFICPPQPNGGVLPILLDASGRLTDCVCFGDRCCRCTSRSGIVDVTLPGVTVASSGTFTPCVPNAGQDLVFTLFPIGSFVGKCCPDENICWCPSDPDSSIQLSANAIPGGTWSIVSVTHIGGGSVTFSDIHDPNATISPTVGAFNDTVHTWSIVLRWSGCGTHDDVNYGTHVVLPG